MPQVMLDGTPLDPEPEIDDEGAPWTWLVIIVMAFTAMMLFLYWNAHLPLDRRWKSLAPSPNPSASPSASPSDDDDSPDDSSSSDGGQILGTSETRLPASPRPYVVGSPISGSRP